MTSFESFCRNQAARLQQRLNGPIQGLGSTIETSPLHILDRRTEPWTWYQLRASHHKRERKGHSHAATT